MTKKYKYIMALILRALRATTRSCRLPSEEHVWSVRRWFLPEYLKNLVTQAQKVSSVALCVCCFACKQEKIDFGDQITYAPYTISISIAEPIKTNFKNGIFTVDFKIESDFESEAFIAMVLRRANHSFMQQ